MKMIEAVIFDVDGTLLDTERIYVSAWREAVRQMGHTLPEDVLGRTRAIDRKISERIFKDALGEDFDYYEAYRRRVEIAEAVIAAGTQKLPKPGAAELLDWLDGHGIKKAVASMTKRERTDAHLAAAGLIDRLPVRVTGDEVHKGKPDPEIFLLAASQLGVRPERCLVCEDSYAGIEAAYRAGMLPVMIPDYVPPRPQERDIAKILPSLYEVIGLMEAENRVCAVPLER